MAQGPGKYDPECAKIQQDTKAAGVLLIVFCGDRGSGFSVAAELGVLAALPQILRDTADSIEKDFANA
jgi:hypothetical protein